MIKINYLKITIWQPFVAITDSGQESSMGAATGRLKFCEKQTVFKYLPTKDLLITHQLINTTSHWRNPACTATSSNMLTK